MDPMNFAKLLRIEEFVKSPVATQTAATLAASCHEIEALKNATLETDEEIKKVVHKYSKTPFLGSSKLPPGSSNVKVSVSHPRYLMSRLHTLRAHLHLLYGEVNEAITELRMSTAHCVRSAEACELLGGTLRLSATCQEQMEEAEKWLLRAIDAGKHLEAYIQERKATHQANATVFLMSPATMYDEQRLAAEQRAAETAGHRLLLLLCQTARCEEADRILRSLGFRFRLSEELLNYNLSVQRHVTLRMSLASTGRDTRVLPTMAVCDDALPPQLLATMQRVFAPDSSFWRQHYYDPLQSLSRSVGFFSYVYPFRERNALSVQEQVVDRLRQIAVDLGVDLSQANYAEWWVHSRVHGAGHQMHYDSDEKHIARGGVPRHPLFSTVVYLCEDVGGPTCVTDQKLNGARGTQAWICMPKMNRVLFFDATHLHGVLPGVGPLSGRRLSFMVGWWPAISSSILTGEKPGAAHCYPPVPQGESAAVSRFHGTQEEPWYVSHGLVEDTSYNGAVCPPVARNVALDVVLAVSSLWTPIATQSDTQMQTDDTPAVSNDDDDIQDKDYELLFQGF